MLGVRREGVTEAAGTLRKAGISNYIRGHITVPSRSLLEQRVCEYYAVVKKEFDLLLSDTLLDVRMKQGALPLTLRQENPPARKPSGKKTLRQENPPATLLYRP
jgi:hypothetical protein